MIMRRQRVKSGKRSCGLCKFRGCYRESILIGLRQNDNVPRAGHLVRIHAAYQSVRFLPHWIRRQTPPGPPLLDPRRHVSPAIWPIPERDCDLSAQGARSVLSGACGTRSLGIDVSLDPARFRSLDRYRAVLRADRSSQVLRGQIARGMDDRGPRIKARGRHGP